MNRSRLVPALLAAVALAVSAGALAAGDHPSPLVDPTWLASHLADKDLVVLHVASFRRDYLAGHVPGARFLWVGAYAQNTPEMSYEVVPLDQLRHNLEALGVSDRSRVVLCGVNGNVSPTARAFVTFDYLGMGDRVSILDGGLEAWKAAGQPLATDVPKVAPGSLHPHVRPDVFVDADWVQAHLHRPDVDLVDARAPQYYKGASAGQLHSGHIPERPQSLLCHPRRLDEPHAS